MRVAKSRTIAPIVVLHDDPWVLAELVDVHFDNGREIKNFLMITGKNGGYVSVCASLPDGRFILTRQCKPAAALTVESVAGARDVGESWEEAARREMIEEVGYVPGRLIKIGDRFFPMSDRADHPCHLFLALDCRPSEEQLLGDEVQGVERLILERAEVMRMIQNGEIHDLATVAGFFAHLNLENQNLGGQDQ